MIVSLSHPFSGFRFCVINQFQLQNCLFDQCNLSSGYRKTHTVPQNLCHHLWDSLASSVHELLCNPIGLGHFCALPSECLALWQCQQLNVSVHHAISVLPLLKAMHHSCLLSWYYTYSIHLHQLAVDFNWCNTHHTQKSKNTSYCKVCHGSGRPSIFNLTYLWYPLIAVRHNLHVPITCLIYSTMTLFHYFMSDILLPYSLKLPCVPVRGRKLKIWYKEHIHNWDE